jgi:hypothetical protein
MEEATKVLPIREIKLEFDGLKPTSCGLVEMLFSNTNPGRGRHIVRLEIVKAKGQPMAWVIAIKSRKQKLREATSGRWGSGVHG